MSCQHGNWHECHECNELDRMFDLGAKSAAESVAALEARNAELLAELEKLLEFTVRYVGDSDIYSETICAMEAIERNSK